ncbi:MAG: CRISPR-associated protein Cas5 [Deltaproteobacteria bacterium]|nr:CRISPR-associated protein Cas5 [Deltaproteobacteria bacterium]
MNYRVHLNVETFHSRLPFAYSHRQTFPIPPISTVIGFLANLFGLHNKHQFEDFNRKHKLKKVAVFCKSTEVLEEYQWLRNLSATTKPRLCRTETQHPGQIIPTFVQQVVKPEVLIYFALDKAVDVQSLNPFTILSLGRAEDLVTTFEISEIELEEISPLARDSLGKQFFRLFNRRTTYMFWLPLNTFKGSVSGLDYLRYVVPVMYRYGTVKQNGIQTTVRHFTNVEAFLIRGSLRPLYNVLISGGYKDKSLFFDPKTEMPIFWFDLTNLDGTNIN